MNVIGIGTSYRIYEDDMRVAKQLPAGYYTVAFSQMSGFRLDEHAPLEIREEKIYGVHEDKIQKVLGSFARAEKNFGVILSGAKGIGKSLFAKMIGVRSCEQGMPVIIVDKYIPGIAGFLEDIKQECVVLFDEFDKTFGEVKAADGMAGPQTELLSMLDGFGTGKKLFIFTCNDISKINTYIVNRPGRCHYHIKFGYPTDAEITTYLQDKLPQECWGEIPEVVDFARMIDLNYDSLQAIAFELSGGGSFEELRKDLNIADIQREYFNVTAVFNNGYTVKRTNVIIRAQYEDDETEVYLYDKGGNNVCDITISMGKAVFNPTLGGFVIKGEDVRLDNYLDIEVNDKTQKWEIEGKEGMASGLSYVLVAKRKRMASPF